MNLFKLLEKKKFKLYLKIKEKNLIYCQKLKSKIFYNLTYIYIKNNFLLINKLIQYNTISNIIFKNAYILNDLNVYNDLFILNYIDGNFNNKAKTMIQPNKTKKPLSILLILKKIIFSNKFFFRLLKNEKAFLKKNIYNIFFFLFYYYMINSLTYISFLKFNNIKKKKSLFTVNLFLKKNLKKSFKFFFKNIIMFLYKVSFIKPKKQSLINYLLIKRIKPIWRHKSSDILTYTERRNGVKLKKNIIFDNDDFEWNKLRIRESFNLSYYQLENRLVKIDRQRNHNLLMIKQQQDKKIRELKKQRSSTNFEDFENNENNEDLYDRQILPNKFKKKQKKQKKQKILKNKLKINLKENKLKINLKVKKLKIKILKKQLQNINLIQEEKMTLLKKLKKLKKKIIKKKSNKIEKNKFINLFKDSLRENKIFFKKKNRLNRIEENKLINLYMTKPFKKPNIYTFKKLFVKKTLVKRMFELSFKNDLQLKNAANILKNNKKFKFLTFPINSICKFFFRKSMYNIFMTLVVFPNNLTIGNYSGGHFNILSKRRDRGSINSLKSMSKLISLKIYQSNLSFIIFCPRLFTNKNKGLIKTIFYSFKILNRSPITKIYLYRPVIRNGIRSKKIPRK